MTKLNNNLSFIKLSILLTVLLGLSFSLNGATRTSKAGAVNWNTAADWVEGFIPTASDDVIIAAGSTVTIPAIPDALAKSVTVQGTATLFINSGGKLTVYGNVVVNNSGTLSLDSNGNDAGYLLVYGNYTNLGTTNIGKGNIIVALDYTDSNVTIQNLGNLVVGGNFIATVNVNGGPSIYIINDPTPTISIIPAPGSGTGYTNTVPASEDPELLDAIATLISNPSCNITISLPANSSSCVGQTASFTVTASPANPTPSYSYRWQISTGAEFTDLADGGDISGATTQTLTLSNLTEPMSGYKYRCKVTSTCTKTSAFATLTVNPNVSVSVSITSNLNNQCSGIPITFTAVPTNGGSSPGYQWRVNLTNQGTNSNTFTYSPANGDQVNCTVTSNITCSTNNPATSNIINMVIYQVPSPNPIAPN